MLKKKTIYLLFAGQDRQHPYFSILVLVQSREWNLGPTTLQSSTLPLNQSSRGLTCIERKFNSATKAGIGCMTLWMTSCHFKGHLAQNSTGLNCAQGPSWIALSTV